MKYKIDDRVECRVRVGRTTDAISSIDSDDPIYEFEIVGVKKPDFKYFDYILLIPDSIPNNTGWFFTSGCFSPGHCDYLLDDFDNVDLALIGKRGVGCYERDIIGLVGKKGAYCNKCNMLNEYIDQNPNYVCYNCRS